MEPISSVNTADYAAAVPQNTGGYYSSIPAVYDTEYEDKKRAASAMHGLTALGILALGGIVYGVNKHMKVRGLKEDIAKAVKEKEAVQKELESAQDKLKELEEKKRPWWKKIFSFKKTEKAEEVKPETGGAKPKTPGTKPADKL